MTDTQPRPARQSDVDQLVQLEQASFDCDRLSRRRFIHWIKARNGLLYVIEHEHAVLAYGLVLLHKGTRLARLYSIAVSSEQQGHGLGAKLLDTLESVAAERGRLFMRLEVAKQNQPAIGLYQKLGYRVFGEYTDYYEDHSDAVRMQKRIRFVDEQQLFHPVPWYQQSTDFTCGPASLMMAMARLSGNVPMNQHEELTLWREATTIFMTSGHGGCHPLGLALAAKRRGFEVTAVLNIKRPLFIEGVRSPQKKAVMSLVDATFRADAKAAGVVIRYEELSQDQIQAWLDQGYAVIALISTYRLDGRKVPHWVTVTAMDDACLYVHDPDVDDASQSPLDCQHIPIARDDFAKMAAFGKERLRTALAIRLSPQGQEPER